MNIKVGEIVPNIMFPRYSMSTGLNLTGSSASTSQPTLKVPLFLWVPRVS